MATIHVRQLIKPTGNSSHLYFGGSTKTYLAAKELDKASEVLTKAFDAGKLIKDVLEGL